MNKEIAAVVLAAGFSSRMGEQKALMSLGGVEIIRRQIRSLKLAGVQRVIVVTGFNSEAVASSAEEEGADVVFNSSYSSGMFSSVKAGLEVLRKDLPSAFFVLPVDIPLVQPFSFIRLMEAFNYDQATIVYPVFNGRRGHPPLISANFISEIFLSNGDGGLRAVLGHYGESSIELEIEDEGCLIDMDTPEAWLDVQRYYEQRQLPSIQECLTLLDEAYTPDVVVAHCRKTSELACRIGEAVNKAGCDLSLPLLQAAALLHDIKKTEPNHALAGARFLRLYGLDYAADITAAHMDHVPLPCSPLNETDIVYLSDKLLDGIHIKPLALRRSESLERKGIDAEICKSINRRFDSAEEILIRVEALTGINIPKDLLLNH